MIRRADPRDAEECLAVYAPYVTDTAYTFETEVPSVEEMTRRIGAAKLWLVAQRGERVAGFAYGGTHRSRAAYRWTVETSVYVGAGHTRQGVGRELYTTLLPALADRGFRMAVAAITLPNPGSIGLHEAVGFRQAGAFREIGFKAGRWWDVGWWQCRLREPGDGAPDEPHDA